MSNILLISKIIKRVMFWKGAFCKYSFLGISVTSCLTNISIVYITYKYFKTVIHVNCTFLLCDTISQNKNFHCNHTVKSSTCIGSGSRLRKIKCTTLETMVLKLLEGEWKLILHPFFFFLLSWKWISKMAHGI